MQLVNYPRWFLCLGVWAATSAGAWCDVLADEALAPTPVLQLDVPNPTTDKPQSKLWFAQGTWWAWLPNREGSSVWRRTTSGWQRAQSLDASLRALPGRADVLLAGDTVRAVLVGGRRLAIVTLRESSHADGYSLVGQPVQFQLHDGEKHDGIETATIAQDGCGGCWIAYPWQRRMWVRAALTADQSRWSEPFAVSEKADRDDLCAVVALPGGIGVAWSNQANDTMNFRMHKDGDAVDQWLAAEVIERGHRNADDHIHAKVTADGTLLLATKNSVDQVGQAQLVLRVRSPEGRWANFPYAPRTATQEPSRPILLLGNDPAELLLFHTLYGRSDTSGKTKHNTIVWQAIPLARLNAETLAAPSHTLIAPGTAVNNVTGCKATLPAGSPWIVLASDASGRVYEGLIESNRERPSPSPDPQ